MAPPFAAGFKRQHIHIVPVLRNHGYRCPHRTLLLPLLSSGGGCSPLTPSAIAADGPRARPRRPRRRRWDAEHDAFQPEPSLSSERGLSTGFALKHLAYIGASFRAHGSLSPFPLPIPLPIPRPTASFNSPRRARRAGTAGG